MRMKNRLSLTIDPVIARKAKRVAKLQNRSLSSLVEAMLSEAVSDGAVPERKGSFSKRWSGKLDLEPKSEPRFNHLGEKYGLK